MVITSLVLLKAKILGGEGSGATATPTVQTVTGLSLLNSGRSYQSAPTLIFEGGGGQGAQGAAKIDQNGKVTNINIVDPGEFYQTAPYILLTGGGGIVVQKQLLLLIKVKLLELQLLMKVKDTPVPLM